MSPAPVALIVLAAVVSAVVAIAAVISFNALVASRQAIADAWAVIDVELERRHHLVPQLVESVRSAAVHERQVLDRLVAAERTAAATNRTAADLSAPEHDVEIAARAVVALRERHPQLDSQKNFLRLQEDLAITEDRIGAARRFHNMKVAEYNRRTEAVPSKLVADRCGFGRAAYFGETWADAPTDERGLR